MKDQIKRLYDEEESDFDLEDYREAKKSAEGLDTFYHVVRHSDVDVEDFCSKKQEACFSLQSEPLFTDDIDDILVIKMTGKAKFCWDNDVTSEMIEGELYAKKNSRSAYSEVWAVPCECQLAGTWYSDEDQDSNMMPVENNNGVLIF